MLKGFDKFKEFFSDYSDCYIIIGGLACEFYEEEANVETRATRDIDIVLIVDSLTPEFTKRFWEFVKAGGYSHNATGHRVESNKKCQFYRFNEPENIEFPKQVELLARRPDVLADAPDDIVIGPVRTGEEQYSLSAILMSDAYYAYTVSNCVKNSSGIPFTSMDSLICLKAKAYLELMKSKEKGEHVNTRDIKKHRGDVFRMLYIYYLTDSDEKFIVPNEIKEDLLKFCERMQTEMPNESFMGAAGIQGINGDSLLDILKTIFKL